MTGTIIIYQNKGHDRLYSTTFLHKSPDSALRAFRDDWGDSSVPISWGYADQAVAPEGTTLFRVDPPSQQDVPTGIPWTPKGP